MLNESQEREQGKKGADLGGRGESRGQGRGGRGRVSKHPEPTAGPSLRTYEEEHTMLAKQAKRTKRRVANLPVSVKRDIIEKTRSDELERFLLPDAPPRIKRSRKRSPVRTPCRLTQGTLMTPPPRKLQPWEIRQQEREASRQEPTPAKNERVVSSSDSGVVPDSSTPRVDSKKNTQKRKTSHPMKLVPTTASKPDVVRGSDPKTSDPMKLVPTTASKPDVVRGSDPKTSDPMKLVPTTASKPDVVRGSGKVDDIVARMWEGLQSDAEDMDPDEEGIDVNAAVDFAYSQPALPILFDTDQEQWLEREDIDSDRLLRDLLPTDDSVDYLTFDWSHDPDTFTGKREEFKGKSGPTFEVNDTTRAIDVFKKFFDDDFLDMIVRRTNQHATVVISRGLTESSRLNRWIDTDRQEIAIFFSILMLQGLSPLPVEKNYWVENGYLTMPRFKTLMSYHRFVMLKRLLYFSEDRTMTDKLRKIMPVLNHLNERFSSLYYPGRDIAIDESLLKWHGRLSFAQRIATKAAKVGVKSYELCESTTGYLWKFFIYTGKGQRDQTDETQQTADTAQTDQTAETDETGRTALPPPTNATARIVHSLVKPLLNRGHTLTMDNFYNSPLLARYLKANLTDCFGTIRVNREFIPESIKSVAKGELRVGEIVQSFCRDLSVVLWRDNNLVSLISTFHRGQVGGKEKDGRYKFKPQVVLDYNLSMGGVDKKDQLLSAHPMERGRNLVWYKKVFRRLLNVTILNSYIIFKSHHKKIEQRTFREQLVNEMIQLYKRPEIEAPSSIIASSLICDQPGFKRPILVGNHFVGTGKTNRARCVWCKQSRSKYICKQCGVTLCLEICFEKFHTVRDRPKGSASRLQ